MYRFNKFSKSQIGFAQNNPYQHRSYTSEKKDIKL